MGKRQGACFAAANEKGVTLGAWIVPGTGSEQYNAAMNGWKSRPGFKPKCFSSDTYPHGKEYMQGKLGNDVPGQLGLFHYNQRIIGCMRPSHTDFLEALTALLLCIYEYHKEDWNGLLAALKSGTMNGDKHEDDQIEYMRVNGVVRERYRAYLRFHIHNEQTIIHNLDNWHTRWKVEASEGARPAKGRKCPMHGITLFIPDMRNTIDNCKKKASEIQDRLPFVDTYEEVPANPNSKHGLSKWKSLRGESNLESYHGTLQHFGNTGQKTSLADNLNLEGTTKRNLNKWQQEQLIGMPAEERQKVPAGFEKNPNVVQPLAPRPHQQTCRKGETWRQTLQKGT